MTVVSIFSPRTPLLVESEDLPLPILTQLRMLQTLHGLM